MFESIRVMELYEIYSLCYGIVLLFYSSAVIVVAFNVWRRKNIQPLKFREPKLMLIMLFSGGVTIGMICFRELDPSLFSCSLYVWISCLFPSSFFAPYFLRCLRLKFVFHWMQSGPATRTIHKNNLDGDQDYKWYKTRRKWVASGTLLIIFFLVFAAHIALAYYIDMSIQTSPTRRLDFIGAGGDTTQIGCIFDYEFLPFFVISFVYLALFFVCLFTLRNVEDHYGTKKELYQCAGIWLLCLTPFFATNLFSNLYWTDELFANANWIIIMITLCSFISLVVPLCQTYRPLIGYSTHNFPSHVSSITEVLSNPKLEETFSKYVTACLEPKYTVTLGFLSEVARYKKTCHDELLQRNPYTSDNILIICGNISLRYLEDHAEYELSHLKTHAVYKRHISELVTQIRQNKNENYPVIFDEISKICADYLNQNVLQGFLQSEGYLNYCDNIRVVQNVSEAMHDLDLT